MTILLLGLIGSGKTAVGLKLSQKLSFNHIEMDKEVLERTGEDSQNFINEILWKECQIEVCKDLSMQENLIISGSGSIAENDLNIIYFKDDNGEEVKIVYLKAKENTLVKRITDSRKDLDKKTVQKQIKDFMITREPLFEKWADIIIETDDMSVEEIAEEIINTDSK